MQARVYNYHKWILIFYYNSPVFSIGMGFVFTHDSTTLKDQRRIVMNELKYYNTLI